MRKINTALELICKAQYEMTNDALGTYYYEIFVLDDALRALGSDDYAGALKHIYHAAESFKRRHGEGVEVRLMNGAASIIERAI